jgi:hypothetical protein
MLDFRILKEASEINSGGISLNVKSIMQSPLSDVRVQKKLNKPESGEKTIEGIQVSIL